MATSISGKVLSITADRVGTYILLDNDPGIGPKDNLFRLMLDHVNYNAIYSLALTAAVNRWNLHIRIQGDGEISSSVEAAIKHARVNW